MKQYTQCGFNAGWFFLLSMLSADFHRHHPPKKTPLTVTDYVREWQSESKFQEYAPPVGILEKFEMSENAVKIKTSWVNLSQLNPFSNQTFSKLLKNIWSGENSFFFFFLKYSSKSPNGS